MNIFEIPEAVFSKVFDLLLIGEGGELLMVGSRGIGWRNYFWEGRVVNLPDSPQNVKW